VYIHGKLLKQFQDHSWLSEQLLESQAPLKKVTGMIFTISKLFLEASRNFISDFLHQRAAKNCENQMHVKKILFDF
jgi:hypothetical protein